MRRSNLLLSFCLILAVVTMVAGCGGGKSPETIPTPPPQKVETPPPPAPPVKEVKETFAPIADPKPTWSEIAAELNRKLQTVYFGFDSSEIPASARTALRQNADVLNEYPDVRVVVEGHCDERGTIEYNLALGERRASAVRDYLTSLGVARSRIRIITYGEERPAVSGHSESAWSRNRRAAFKAEQ